MKNAFSTKFSAIGGASMLALSAGLAMPTAAQEASPPPASGECAQVMGATPPAVVCSPGIDPDGFSADLDGATLSVENGALVEGEIDLGNDITATIGGSLASLIHDGVVVGYPAPAVPAGA